MEYGSIVKIEEVTNVHGGMDGYKIATDRAEIYVLISGYHQCCESWGYFSSEDDLDDYIGADLREVNLTDVCLNKKAVEKSDWYDDEGGIQFVDFLTSRGTLQLAVYNAHNGYYGHRIALILEGVL